jgi:hypothetical protein
MCPVVMGKEASVAKPLTQPYLDLEREAAAMLARE